MFVRKYFVSIFTFNGSSGIDSSRIVQLCTNKSFIKDQSNLPTYTFIFKTIKAIKTVTLFVIYTHLNNFYVYI